MLDLPDSDPRTYLGTDKNGGHWLIKWNVPAAPDRWSAAGWDSKDDAAAFVLDAKGYCLDGLTGKKRERIVHAIPLHRGARLSVTTAKTVRKRLRALEEKE